MVNPDFRLPTRVAAIDMFSKFERTFTSQSTSVYEGTTHVAVLRASSGESDVVLPFPPSSCFPSLFFWCVKAHLDYKVFPHPGTGVLIIKSLALCEARKGRWQVGSLGQERASMTDKLHMVEENREE